MRYDGLTPQSREKLDFSAGDGVMHFGFAVLDADTRQGHRSWAVVDNFSVTAFGPAPGAFPVDDGDLLDADWTLISMAHGRGEATSERVRGGHPGWCRRVTFSLAAPANIDAVLLSQRARYAPATQGALTNTTISVEILETADSPGLQTNPSLLAVVAQAGRIYVSHTPRVAAYSGINDGWEKVAFRHMAASEFSEYLVHDRLAESPDFSTNGGPMHFGVMFRHTTAYRYETNGLATSSRLDNFRVELNPPR